MTGDVPAIVDDVTLLDPLIDRAAHSASLLPDGRVLVAGGCVVDGCSDATAETELYDPATGRFGVGPDLLGPRDGHTATTLPSGDVLVVGGYSGEGALPLATAELYVDATGEFVPAGEMSIGRGAHAAALLADGRVLIVGGTPDDERLLSAVERFNGTAFVAAGSLTEGRYKLLDAVVVLSDGRVLVAGGGESAEAYDPVMQTSRRVGDSTGSRSSFATATVLGDGSVLVVGGYDRVIDLRRDAYLLTPLAPA